MNREYLEDPDLAATTFGDLFAELHARGDLPPIPVGPTLQRHFDGDGTIPFRRRLPIGRGSLIGLAVAGTLAGGLGAAAANELPRPLQRAVSTVVNTVTPFSIATGTEQEPGNTPPAATVAPVMPHDSSADTDADADEDKDSSVDESEDNEGSSGADSGESDDGGAGDDSDSEADEQEGSEAEDSTSEESDGGSESDDSEAAASSSDDDSSSDDGGSSDDAASSDDSSDSD